MEQEIRYVHSSVFTPLRNNLGQLFRALRYQWISAKMTIEKKSKSRGPFWSYQQNSTANSAHLAHFHSELAVLFSW